MTLTYIEYIRIFFSCVALTVLGRRKQNTATKKREIVY